MENLIYTNKNSIVKSFNISSLENYSLNFITNIFCEHNFKKNCNNCIKILNKNNSNVIYLGDYKNNIKKQEFINVMDFLSFSTLSDEKKSIVIIKGIEFSNLISQNTILRWLENLPKDLFILFLSININDIIPTIKSRLPIFSLDRNINDYIIDNEEKNTMDLFINLNKSQYLNLYNKLLKIEEDQFTKFLNKIAINLLKLNNKNYYISKIILKKIFIIENNILLNKKIIIDHMLNEIIVKKEILSC